MKVKLNKRFVRNGKVDEYDVRQMKVALIDDFRIKKTRAQEVIKEVTLAVGKWRTVAAQFGLSKKELDRMASAFEHEDLKKALGVKDEN